MTEVSADQEKLYLYEMRKPYPKHLNGPLLNRYLVNSVDTEPYREVSSLEHFEDLVCDIQAHRRISSCVTYVLVSRSDENRANWRVVSHEAPTSRYGYYGSTAAMVWCLSNGQVIIVAAGQGSTPQQAVQALVGGF